MKRFSILYIITCCLFLVAGNVQAEYRKSRIAVLPFTLQGEGFDAGTTGTTVAERLTTVFAQQGRFEVIAQNHHKMISQEQKINKTGIISEKTASQIGSLLGVDFIVTGSIMKSRTMIEMNVKIIDVLSNSIKYTENIQGNDGAELQQLIVQLADRIIKNFPLEGHITRREQNRVVIDLGLSAGVKQGMKFMVFEEGETVQPSKADSIPDGEKIEKGTIRITAIKPYLAEGIITNEIISESIRPGDAVLGSEIEFFAQRTGPPAGMPSSAPARRKEKVPEEKFGDRYWPDASAARESAPAVDLDLAPAVDSAPAVESAIYSMRSEEQIFAAMASEVNVSHQSAITKYPTVEAPDRVAVHQEFAVQVSLTEDLISPETQIHSVNEGVAKKTAEGQLSLMLPEGDSWPIDVILSAPGFDYLGTNTAAIKLPGHGDSTPAAFRLRAKEISTPTRTGKIYATLWYQGTYLAKITRPIEIEQVKTDSRPRDVPTTTRSQKTTDTPGAGVSLEKTGPLQPITLDFVSEPADLTVFILENQDPDRPRAVQIIVNSPYLQPATETYYNQADISEWLQQYYRRFSGYSTRGLVARQDKDSTTDRNKEQARPLLDGFGRDLYSKFAPPVFKEAFWELVRLRGDKFQSIQIYTTSPILPWELMKPSRRDGSAEMDFLGMQYKIARWHVSESYQLLSKPLQRVNVDKVTCIAPEYKGAEALPAQKTELGGMRQLPGYTVVPGNYGALKKLFAELPSGIIHFSGHGKVRQGREGGSSYSILLEDGDFDLSVWKGLVSKNNTNHPFFIFNACEVGQAEKIANMVNGWAPAVLESGASGYVGALWPIGDTGAADFSIRFYKLLEQENPVQAASMLREIRKQFHATGDPTYLAYILYGDPNMTFYSNPEL